MQQEEKGTIYHIGFSLLIFLTLVVLIATFFYLIGVTMLKYTIFLAFGSAIALTAKTTEISRQQLFVVFVTAAIIIFVCAAWSTFIFDFSYDGNTYHKTTIGMLKNGWNPVYQSFESVAITSKIIPEYNWPIWYDHYPKASWIIGAAFYALTNNIESGKCMTLIAMVATFCILLGTLSAHGILRKKQRYIFALLAVLNPITIPQMQSYYIDGLLQMLIYITIISLIEITFTKYNKPLFQGWILIFCCIQLALNIKYSGLIFFALYCGLFYVYWVVRAYKSKERSVRGAIAKVTGFYIVAVGCAVCFTGATSYMRNLIQHHNLLYTMIGQDKIEIITTMLPDSYATKPSFFQFVHSLFSQTANISAGVGIEPTLKLPFTATRAEWDMGAYFDARIGAWGILFSGIFIVSLILLFPIFRKLIRERGANPGVLQISLLVVGITLGQCLVIPGLAWARYYAHLFIVPLFVIGMLMYFWTGKIFQALAYLLSLIMLLNLSNYIYYTIYRTNISQDIRMEVQYLAAQTSEKTARISLNGGESMQGYLFNLIDADVSYIVDQELSGGTTIFNWQISYLLETS